MYVTVFLFFFFFQAEDGIRDLTVTGVQTCALPISPGPAPARLPRSDWTTWIAGSSWEVRAPRPGDRLVPVGGGGHRPGRRLLMEARGPPSSRRRYSDGAPARTISLGSWICPGRPEPPPVR